jgi:hypothetical protein
MAPESQAREDRIAQIRREIAAGTYETPERLSAAVDRLLQHLEAEAAED